MHPLQIRVPQRAPLRQAGTCELAVDFHGESRVAMGGVARRLQSARGEFAIKAVIAGAVMFLLLLATPERFRLVAALGVASAMIVRGLLIASANFMGSVMIKRTF